MINILILLYVNDASVPFENRNDMIKDLKIIYTIMLKSILTIHIGAGGKSKAGAVFFQSNTTIKLWKKKNTKT